MLNGCLQVIRKLQSLSSYYNQFDGLRKRGFRISFPLEGKVELVVDHVSFMDILQNRRKIEFKNTLDFATRPTAEPLLRLIARKLISDVIPKDTTIIDIGSWIGDNANVWAAMCGSENTIIAIDPSASNLEFSESIAGLNGLCNIVHVQAVCADQVGLPLSVVDSHSIDHAKFKLDTCPDVDTLTSTTIDWIVESHSRGPVSLLHIDVEGFEFKVLCGARETIEKDRPFILFEAHLLESVAEEIFAFLNSFGYEIFMINEVLEGCRLDCRNFLAFPKGGQKDNGLFASEIQIQMNFWPATIGPALIRVS
jgi:FkbM family methyltransferase